MFYDDLSKWKNTVKHKGEIGLEIETEALEPYTVPKFTFWNPKKDDSLRGPQPYEYVLRSPLAFEHEIPSALDEFKVKTSKANFDQNSFTTSVHVHVNMLNEKYQTIGNFLTIYALTENLLKRFAGPSRTSNLFCLPMIDAEENYKNLLRVTETFVHKNMEGLNLDPGACKYAALNLSALWNFGSLEVRLLRGTTDTQVIHDWVGILYSILEFSRQDMTPKEFIQILRQKDKEVLTDIFGKYRKLLKVPDEDDLLNQNFWFAANCALSVTDWKELDKPVQQKKLTHKDLDSLALASFGKIFDDLPENAKQKLVQQYKFFAAGELPKKGKKAHFGGDDNNPFLNEAVLVNIVKAKLKPWGNPVGEIPLDPAHVPEWAMANAAAEQPMHHLPVEEPEIEENFDDEPFIDELDGPNEAENF